MRKKRLPNTNVKPGNHSAPTSHKKKEMRTLRFRNDQIELGVYAGETLSSALKKYGKKALPGLLKYYNLSDEIMRKYHCRLKPHEEKQEAVSAQNKTNVRLKGEVSQVNTNVMDLDDMGFDSNDTRDTSGHVMNDENNWMSSHSDYEDGVLFDPEDDQPETEEEKSMLAAGGAHRYWDGDSFHMGTSINY